MEKKLTINESKINELILLKLSGRLDANWAGYLDDTLNQHIQKGNYSVSMNLDDVVYLSSAGIRILVKQNKAFKNVSGELNIQSMSDNVKTVLDMVGMTVLFEPSLTVEKTKDNKELNVEAGYRFDAIQQNDSAPSVLETGGDPLKMKTCSFVESDNHLIKLDKSFFGLGIGAIGDGFDDCCSRYGEFVSLGEAVAYMPSDNSKAPDYMIRSGQLIPEINTLYYLGHEGSFSHEVAFNPHSENEIPVSTILEHVGKVNQQEDFSFLIIGESAGLVGTSLNIPPVSGKNPFSFPEVRDHMNFTTEPAYLKNLVVAFGVVYKNNDDRNSKFIRPLSENFIGHIHAAVFPYMPLRKDKIDYSEIIETLFNESEVLNVLHLINDTRDIDGLGESLFRNGHVWTNAIN